MTHRLFSRNAASSRAIPIKKMVEDVIRDPALPLFWGKNQKGMQATEELGDVAREKAEEEFLKSMRSAIDYAWRLASCECHKQIVNRILEPYAHITVLASATEWDNFLELRDHDDAEPHIRMLAQEIRKCLTDLTNIQVLEPYEWHLPFISDEDWRQTGNLSDMIILSSARCASTSYKTVEGFDMTLDRARLIYDKLVKSDPPHASPLEHVAQVDQWHDYGWESPHEHANFEGFCQWRHRRPMGYSS